MAQDDVRTKDGYDIQMQANHLSHFLLSELLFDLLEKTAQEGGDARIVSHSSGARNTPDSPLREDAFETSWALLINCDLCDFESVRSAAAEVRKQLTSLGWKLNCLVLNAGLMAQDDVR